MLQVVNTTVYLFAFFDAFPVWVFPFFLPSPPDSLLFLASIAAFAFFSFSASFFLLVSTRAKGADAKWYNIEYIAPEKSSNEFE